MCASPGVWGQYATGAHEAQGLLIPCCRPQIVDELRVRLLAAWLAGQSQDMRGVEGRHHGRTPGGRLHDSAVARNEKGAPQQRFCGGGALSEKQRGVFPPRFPPPPLPPGHHPPRGRHVLTPRRSTPPPLETVVRHSWVGAPPVA